jgi:hypothetical protein
MYVDRANGNNGEFSARVLFLLKGLIPLTVFFGALIFFLSNDTYRLYGNFLEIGVALICMASCLYIWRTGAERIIVLLAAFAFAGYALSNTFWYLYSVRFTTSDAFFTVSELGFLGFMFFFIVTFRIEFQKKPGPVSYRIAVAGFFLTLALSVLATIMATGNSALLPNSVLLAFRLFVLAVLVDTAIDHGVNRYPLIWSGVCLWSCASVIDGLRDTVVKALGSGIVLPFTPNHLSLYDFLSIVGPLFVLSFLQIQIGIFDYLSSRDP